MGKYKCQYPGCDYSTDDSWRIESHHIVPRELGGDDRPYNLVDLCPNHHTLVFVPETKAGQHSRKTGESIIIRGWVKSTGGTLLEYVGSDGELAYREPRV